MGHFPVCFCPGVPGWRSEAEILIIFSSTFERRKAAPFEILDQTIDLDLRLCFEKMTTQMRTMENNSSL